MPKLLSIVAALVLFQLTGCDDAPKPRQPPAGVTTESNTVEELRERRRAGDSITENPGLPPDRSRTTSAGGSRGTPEERAQRAQRAKAAAAAEAASDADADRPTRATD